MDAGDQSDSTAWAAVTSALLGIWKGLIQPFVCFPDHRIKWNGQWVQANPTLIIPALDRKAACRKGDLLPSVLFSSPGTSPLFQPEPAGWLNDLGLEQNKICRSQNLYEMLTSAKPQFERKDRAGSAVGQGEGINEPCPALKLCNSKAVISNRSNRQETAFDSRSSYSSAWTLAVAIMSEAR